jgi:phytoene dehydrogenase-like protein
MYDTLRFWTMSCADLLDEYFESEIVKAHLAGSSIIGTALGPRSPGTAYVLLHHYMGSIDGTVGAWGFARGGMGSVSAALAKSFQASGGTIRSTAPVHQILVRNGRATGVALDDGEEIYARTVVSNMDVKRTFLETMDSHDLPDEFVKQVRNFKIRGSSGKLNIALDGLPSFPSIPQGSPSTRGDMHVTDTIEMLERAYDDWKEGRWSRAPYIDMLIPSQIDPTMAPDGKHYMSVFVQYCPYKLADGEWNDARRKAFGNTVIDTISRVSPNFKDLILHAEIRTPWDIENEVGLTEGNIFQGELTLDQLLFNRPVPGYAQYRAPVRGMYMCGSSTHPGGGVMGAPGYNAAGAILRDLGRAVADHSGYQGELERKVAAI